MDHERLSELFDLVYTYSDTHPNFDTAFVDDLHSQYEEREHLSEAQIGALENIVLKWRME